MDIVYKKEAEETVIPMPRKNPSKDFNNEYCSRFNNWLMNSLPGDKFCYFLGDYISGNSVARLAYRAYEHGQVILFQKKEGTKYGYWAQKLTKWGE